MTSPRVDPAIITAVLSGASFPARTWQLLVQADHYGASGQIRTVLARLPSKIYPSLEAVLSALEHINGPDRPGHRPG